MRKRKRKESMKERERERQSNADVWSRKADRGAVIYSLTNYKLKRMFDTIVN